MATSSSWISARVCTSRSATVRFGTLTTALVTAFFASSPPKEINTPLSLHPPELAFKRPLTQAVDIWNLGCTVRRVSAAATSRLLTSSQMYELVVGHTLFEAGFDNLELIPQYEKVLGGVPAEWVREALADGVLNGDEGLSPLWRGCTLH